MKRINVILISRGLVECGLDAFGFDNVYFYILKPRSYTKLHRCNSSYLFFHSSELVFKRSLKFTLIGRRCKVIFERSMKITLHLFSPIFYPESNTWKKLGAICARARRIWRKKHIKNMCVCLFV